MVPRKIQQGRSRASFRSSVRVSWMLLLSLFLTDGIDHQGPVTSVEALSSSTPSRRRRNPRTSPESSSNKNKNGRQSSIVSSKKQRRPATNPNVSKRTNTQKQHSNHTPQTISETNQQKAKARSIGEAVQQANTVESLLEVASQLWLPTDPELPSHLCTQAIHHERRQRWSAQLLAKLGDTLLGCSIQDKDELQRLWQDQRLGRAVLAAALPFASKKGEHTTSLDDMLGNDKAQRAVQEALMGLHTMTGHTVTCLTSSHDIVLHKDIRDGIQLLLERAKVMADVIALSEAVQMRWAARGILVRLSSAIVDYGTDEDTWSNQLASTFPLLEARVAGLPFDILPMGIDFADDSWSHKEFNMDSPADIMTHLQQAIPFQMDTIVTRQGSKVTERRATAWVAEENIGALAYSGKLMPPYPMPPLVRAIMRRVEFAIDAPGADYFDCALCNFYPDGESACKFHTDPEHGTVWERLNCVVAVGNARRFAFRPIAGKSTWSEWDNVDSENADSKKTETDDSENLPTVIRVFPGDIVKMWGTCNDDFYHAVYPETTIMQGEKTGDSRRVSLVLKRAMALGSKGRRGHGLAGEGRRARRLRTKA